VKLNKHTGALIAFLLIALWAFSLGCLLRTDLALANPLIYLMVFVQMHLHTGLFITAHDAMHRAVSPSEKLNLLIGHLCTLLYAAFSFRKLFKKHHEHHRFVHSDLDPDYHKGNFISWYLQFMREYLSLVQILIMAVVFNILKLWYNEVNLLIFWVLPSLLSTLQLFYFGTWLPHHGEHDNLHQSRSQKPNHFSAFISCYFFGYHYEHHDSPGTPWWLLWTKK